MMAIKRVNFTQKGVKNSQNSKNKKKCLKKCENKKVVFTKRLGMKFICSFRCIYTKTHTLIWWFTEMCLPKGKIFVIFCVRKKDKKNLQKDFHAKFFFISLIFKNVPSHMSDSE